MNYFEIGQRIRRIRKAKHLSQEQLAEKAGISVTHMSHIETANTKLSLPVFAALATILEVQMDALLYETPPESTDTAVREISKILEGCSAKEARIIADMAKSLKQSFDIYL